MISPNIAICDMNCNNKWDVMILEVNIYIKYDPAAVKDYTYKILYVVYCLYFYNNIAIL